MSDWGIGHRVRGRYDVRSVIKGGMGTVYIAYDGIHQEMLALKTLHEHLFLEQADARQRFLAEARSWLNVEFHPNIVLARTVEIIENRPVLFLEYVSGGNLREWIGRSGGDLIGAVRLAIQLCDGMAHAYARGVAVHRDIKPENCLMTDDGVLKLTDFGLAKVGDQITHLETRAAPQARGGERLTRVGTSMGTPEYMAPEQFRSGRDVDLRADVYSFGVMMHEMIAKTRPVRAHMNSGESWATAHEFLAPIPLLSSSSTMNSLVQRCLAKAPADRFSNFGEVRSELEKVYVEVWGSSAPAPPTSQQVRRISDLNLNNRGMAAAEFGEYQEAIVLYDRALKQNPAHAGTWNNKGNALRKLNRIEAAQNCYQRALTIDSNHALASANLGSLFLELERFEEARKHLERATKLDATNARSWRVLGLVYEGEQASAMALDCYDQAISIDSRFGEAHLSKGMLLVKLHQNEAAIGCLKKAVELDSTDSERWFQLGNGFGQMGQHELAIEHCDQALAQATDDWRTADGSLRAPHAWGLKAASFLLLGQFQAALDCYERCTDLEPTDGRGWIGRAACLIAVGRTEEAQACLSTANSLGVSQAEIDDIFGSS